ncbi:MAG: bifunctional adenosylcobinamide kinase/adenosylcobinamide-phosphate guanylyltransferase [Micromonosporaceae bacterium]|nr:bifunctional adenosylcobinamide kinase/adenosylcobinamide-phosphate guanylyltransferase [Micromonosporaceae bacterium]
MSVATPSLSPSAPSTTLAAAIRRVLLLGGIRSGKSAVAEALVTATAARRGLTDVRYVATAAGDDFDPAWSARIAAHQARRPAGWTSEEIAAAPERLVELLASAKPAEAFLVDDLGGWLTATIGTSGRWDDPHAADEDLAALATAVTECQGGLLVLVSPEVGLTVIPPSEAGRTFADAQGELNRRLADCCEATGLVVAGRTIWLPSRQVTPAGQEPGHQTASLATIVTVTEAAPVDPTSAELAGPAQASAELVTIERLVAEPAAGEFAAEEPATEEPSPDPAAFDVPVLDEALAEEAAARLRHLDVDGPGLGALTALVRFAACAQGTAAPAPWRDIRMFLLRGDHQGAISAGTRPEHSERRLADALAGQGVLALLAAEARIPITGVDCPASAAIETQDALTSHEVDLALAAGRRLADNAIDAGADLLVVASCGAGSSVAATAVCVMFAGGEPASLIPRAAHADGTIDDASWMRWCVALRDALHRTRQRFRTGRSMLAAVGGGDIAVAAGIMLGAASRRTPVLIDGPVGAAAAFIARDLAAATPRWILLLDHGGHPTTEFAATVLDLHQIVDLRLGLGEGCAALTALPVIQTALRIAAMVEVPDPAEQQPEQPEPAEQQPEQPEPAEQQPEQAGEP